MKKEIASLVNTSKQIICYFKTIFPITFISMHLTLNATVNNLIGTRGLGHGLGYRDFDSDLGLGSNGLGLGQ